MSFTVEDFHDLIELLAQHPEWRAELRRHVLSDELLELPALVRQLVEAQMRTDLEIAGLAAAHRLADARLERVESHLERVESHLEKVGAQLEQVGDHLIGLDARLDRLRAHGNRRFGRWQSWTSAGCKANRGANPLGR